MHPDQLKAWRQGERKRLIALREALDPGTLGRFRLQIDAHLAQAFPNLASSTVAFCWPIRGEYDARHLAKKLRALGAATALPVVVAPRQPLIFREWHPGVEMGVGPLDIPYPLRSAQVQPDAVLLPMNGWDAAGYRLGYGGGFFDRTLAALAAKPLVIGIGYEMARMPTVHPQSWDVPVDRVVTERGVYCRGADGLTLEAQPRNNR